MARTGRPKTPTKLKVLRGTAKPGDTGETEPSPKIPTGGLVQPVRMTARARAIWKRIIRDYGDLGILTGVDTETFRAYVEACARYELSAEALDRSTPTILSDRGAVIANPLHRITRDNALLMLRLARELGFTPSARASLSTPKGGDELDAWSREG